MCVCPSVCLSVCPSVRLCLLGEYGAHAMWSIGGGASTNARPVVYEHREGSQRREGYG